jgi:hypothetical protein
MENLPEKLERALVGGDLKDLSSTERLQYYNAVCSSLKLNPLTKPFEYITLNGRLVLYAKKDCTEQLRKLYSISLKIVARELVDGIYIVTAQATTPDGRTDESIGAVSIEGLKGDMKANSTMKAETKSKRRVTLSICGLGMLDESEIETIPNARVKQPEQIQEEQKQIDVGGNPMNSREAQAHVLDRKMRELKAAPEPESAVPVTSQRIPPPVVEIWNRMISIEARCKEFLKLKEELQQTAGTEEGEICYYSKLSLFGAKHSNELAKKAHESRKCVMEIWRAIQNYKRADNPDISDEDIPR